MHGPNFMAYAYHRIVHLQSPFSTEFLGLLCKRGMPILKAQFLSSCLAADVVLTVRFLFHSAASRKHTIWLAYLPVLTHGK